MSTTTGLIVIRRHALLPFCASLQKNRAHIVDCTVAGTCKKLLFIVNDLQKMVYRWTTGTDAWHGTLRHARQENKTKCKLTKDVILMKVLYNLAENNCLSWWAAIVPIDYFQY